MMTGKIHGSFIATACLPMLLWPTTAPANKQRRAPLAKANTRATVRPIRTIAHFDSNSALNIPLCQCQLTGSLVNLDGMWAFMHFQSVRAVPTTATSPEYSGRDLSIDLFMYF